MKVAIFDNGHGNNTKGKRSPDESIFEWSYTRKLVDEIIRGLDGIPGLKTVKLVPEDKDISLSTRVKRANVIAKEYGKNNTILISVHLNANSNGSWQSANYWSVWTSIGQTAGDKLADVIFGSAFKILDPNGIRVGKQDWKDGDPDYESNFTILKNTSCAAVITENLFQDNKENVKYLLTEEGFNSIVKLHVDAVRNYFKI